MNKKYLAIYALVLFSIQAKAQETYETAPLLNHDLNGTARYVGMGGAMEALGADISTINSNPAGIGLFRRSQAVLSAGITALKGDNMQNSNSKTVFNFDQVGFVYTMRDWSTGRSNINFAFNYHKSKNFNDILRVADQFPTYTVNGVAGTHISSQNKSTYQKLLSGVATNRDQRYSYLDEIYVQNVIYDEPNNQNVYYPAQSYLFERDNTGYIGNYDFNVSGSVNDRFYWGLTVGIKDVHYNNNSIYTENLVNNLDGITELSLASFHRITGTGFDINGGIIVRPIADSPFRFGINVSTPTWYRLNTYKSVSLRSVVSSTSRFNGGVTTKNLGNYDFSFYTPWKFGASLGHTVGNYLALGASYEYTDYSSSDMRINDGYVSDGWYTYESSVSDYQMNRNIKTVLKGVSTVKVGMEIKPIPDFAVRLGYNYLSPMYKETGMKNMVNYEYISSPGAVLTTSSDYTNWKSTNRFTVGLGWQLDKWNIDLAYQYASTNGSFNPFNSLSYGTVASGDTASPNDNFANVVNVSDKRHQVLLSIGYRF